MATIGDQLALAAIIGGVAALLFAAVTRERRPDRREGVLHWYEDDGDPEEDWDGEGEDEDWSWADGWEEW